MISLSLQASEHLYVISLLVNIGYQGYLIALAHDIQQYKVKSPKVQATTAIYPIHLSTMIVSLFKKQKKSFVDAAFVTIHLVTRDMQSILIDLNR